MKRGGLVALVAGLLAAGGGAYWYLNAGGERGFSRTNAITVIAPYWYEGAWVFDDPRTGLVREPFVAGVPEMIDIIVRDIPSAREGFLLYFSTSPFPGFRKKLTWVRGDSVGNYYKFDDSPVEGWLCPAFFKYYEKPPEAIYVKAEAKRR